MSVKFIGPAVAVAVVVGSAFALNSAFNNAQNAVDTIEQKREQRNKALGLTNNSKECSGEADDSCEDSLAHDPS